MRKRNMYIYLFCIIIGVLINPYTINSLLQFYINSETTTRFAIIITHIVFANILANDLYLSKRKAASNAKQYFLIPSSTKNSTKLKESSPSIPEEDQYTPLTPQEKVLVDLILKGYTGVSIAKIMNISVETQKSYRKNIYSKLAIHSKEELFRLAYSKNTDRSNL